MLTGQNTQDDDSTLEGRAEPRSIAGLERELAILKELLESKSKIIALQDAMLEGQAVSVSKTADPGTPNQAARYPHHVIEPAVQNINGAKE